MSKSRAQRFRMLYDRRFRLVWSVVGQFGVSAAAREDVVQEVWITAYRRLHTLNPEASERAWLCSIARKVAWRTRRSAQRLDRRISAYADEPVPAATDALARYEAVTTVQAALESLSEEQRRVLVLTSLHGLSAPEVAKALAVPLNTVYSRLRLARKRLADFADRPELVAELQRREQPADGARTRVLAAIGAGSGPPWLAAAAKPFALGGLFGGVAVAFVVTSVGAGPTPSRTPEPEDASAAASPHEPQPVQQRVVPMSRQPSFRPTPEPFQSVPVSKSAKPSRPAIARVQERPARSGRPTEAVPSPASRIEAETALLGEAQRALERGDAAQALRRLKQHALQFPDGVLVDVREGARVRALCALGRNADAVRAARTLARLDPSSPVAAAVEDVCRRHDGSGSTRR